MLKDADDKVGGRFEWYLGGTLKGSKTIDPVTNGSISSGLAFSATITSGHFSDNQVIKWRVRAEDDYSESGWSPYCYLEIDTTAPLPPGISSPHYPDDGQEHEGLGHWGYFDFTAGSSDVVKYGYTFPGEPEIWVDATSQGGGKRIAWTPLADGPFTLQVRSEDNAGKKSTYSTHTFRVAPGSLPVAYWKMDDTSGTAATGVPGGCIDICPDATLAGGATWNSDGRVDGALNLDGVNGYAATTGPVVETNDSYTVSAWVNMTDDADHQTVVSQSTGGTARTSIYYSANAERWRVEAPISPTTHEFLASDDPPVVGEWTHLAAVFDNGRNELIFYVNGVENDRETFDGREAPGGGFQIGRKFNGSTYYEYFDGLIDEVRVYNRALSSDEIEDMVTSAAVLESYWAFDEKTGSTSANQVPGGPLMELHDGADWNYEDPEFGFGWFFGDSNLVLDETDDPDPNPDFANTWDGNSQTQDWAVDTSESYSVSVWAQAYKLPTGSHRSPVISQGESTSAFSVEARVASDGVARWVLVIPESTDPGAAETLVWSDQPVIEVGDPAHLTVTYNALDRLATLYVGASCSRWDPATGQTMQPCQAADVPSVVGASGWVNVGKSYKDDVQSFFTGEVDEVRLYSGVLSQTQIAQLGAPA